MTESTVPKVTRRDAIRITAVTGIAAAFGGGLSLGILRQAGLRRVSETRPRMGTVVTLTVVHSDPAEARALIAAAFDEIDRLESIFSRHRADSALGRLNLTGRLEGAPSELVGLLGASRQLSDASGGAFDVTVLPILRLYERSYADLGAPPPLPDVRRALERVDYTAIEVDGEVVTLAQPGVAVTLDGIAKGYIVDRTVQRMVHFGAERVLVNAGGDIASGGGGSDLEPWTVGLEDPHDAKAVLGFVRLGGDCVATSGDYLQAFTQDRSQHHIIDPRTGSSPGETSAVSVLAGSAAEADALSTAVLVLGPARGRDLLETTPGVEGLIVTKSGARVFTTGMHQRAG